MALSRKGLGPGLIRLFYATVVLMRLLLYMCHLWLKIPGKVNKCSRSLESTLMRSHVHALVMISRNARRSSKQTTV